MTPVLRRALRMASGLSLAAGVAWWARDTTSGSASYGDDRPLSLRHRSRGRVLWCVLSRDGRQVVWYDDWRVQITDTETGRTRPVFEAGGLWIERAYPHSAAVTPDARYLVAQLPDRLVRVRCADGVRDGEVRTPPGTRLLDVADDGGRALTMLQPPLTGLVTVDLAARRAVGTLRRPPPRLAWLVRGSAAVLVNDAGGAEPELWAVATGERLPSPWRGTAGVVGAYPVGSRVALLCRDGGVRWLGGGRPLETPLSVADRIVGADGSASLLLEGETINPRAAGERTSLIVGPDGHRKVALPGETILAVSSRGDYALVRGEGAQQEVLFGQLASGRQWPIPEAGNGAAAAGFSRDGGRLAVAGARALVVLDVRRPAPAPPAP